MATLILNRAGSICVAVLLAAAAYELVLALRHTIPNGEGFVLLIAVVAMLGGMVLVFRRVRLAGLIAPAAALFVTARFYTDDPYYGQTFRRYADGGLFSPAWIFALLGLGLVAGLTTALWRRTAPVESAATLILSIFTSLFMGAGH